MKNRSIAFVVPRYNAGSAGGAEVLCQNLAEELARAGRDIHVYTTCARDSQSWADHFPEGEETVRGVRVRRFPLGTRDTALYRRLDERLNAGETLSLDEQLCWLENGVFSPALQRALEREASGHGCLILLPYLFGITYFGAMIDPAKTLLIPCLHDEAFARLPVIGAMFGAVRGALFNSQPEQYLAERLFGFPAEKSAVVGMGIDAGKTGDSERFRAKYGLEAPFILYAGRREAGKNVPLLVEYFKIYRNNRRADLKLALLGSGALEDLPPGVVDLGYAPEQDKLDAMAAAAVFCQPSVNESFSIVLLEAWTCGTPALVHALCPVTRGHCLESNGGLFFTDYFEFEACLDFLLDNPGARAAMGQNGRDYVRSRYHWPRITEAFDAALGRFFP